MTKALLSAARGGDKRSRSRVDLIWVLAPICSYLLLQAAELGCFIRQESRPPAWDQANHLDIALQYARAIRAGAWATLWNLEPKHYIPPFPPLYHLALSWIYATANPTWNALWTNWGYLALLSFFIYGLAREKRAETASAAALAFCCAPAVQWLLHNQLIDLSVCACAAAAYWAWIRSDGFSRREPSAAFGLAFAAGMMHKWSFFSYMLVPLWSAASGLRKNARRANVVMCFMLVFVLAGPWYLARLPLILQRLVQASEDQAIPFWRGGVFFVYLRSLPGALGAWFCLAAFAALWSSRRDPSRRSLAACALLSYLFWALVPNRQPRYLLPGLCVLPVLIAWSLPRPAVWALAALQLAGGAYETSKNWPPRRENWPLEEIVGAAGSQGMSLVADHERLNNLNLIFTARLLGLSPQIQSAQNKLWELEPFVLLKRDNLGPASVIPGLIPIRSEILRPDGAFSRGFAVERIWPLPDGDKAVLYHRREHLGEPFGGAKTVRARKWSTDLFSLQDPDMRLGRWAAGESLYDKVTVESSRANLRGIDIADVKLEFLGARLLPDGAMASPENLHLLRLRRLRVLSARISSESLRRTLELRGMRVRDIRMDDTVAISGSYRHLPFEATLRLDCGGSIRVSLTALSIAGVPIPAAVLGASPLLRIDSFQGMTTLTTPYWANLKRDFPFELEAASCRAADGEIAVR